MPPPMVPTAAAAAEAAAAASSWSSTIASCSLDGADGRAEGRAEPPLSPKVAELPLPPPLPPPLVCCRACRCCCCCDTRAAVRGLAYAAGEVTVAAPVFNASATALAPGLVSTEMLAGPRAVAASIADMGSVTEPHDAGTWLLATDALAALSAPLLARWLCCWLLLLLLLLPPPAVGVGKGGTIRDVDIGCIERGSALRRCPCSRESSSTSALVELQGSDPTAAPTAASLWELPPPPLGADGSARCCRCRCSCACLSRARSCSACRRSLS